MVLYLLSKGGRGGSSSSNSSAPSSAPRTPPAPPRTAPRPTSGSSGASTSTAPKGYQPRQTTGGVTGVRFDVRGEHGTRSTLGELVTDFVTGATLRTSPSTYQCSSCLAFYSTESFDLLRIENNGRCASCRSATLRQLGSSERQRPPPTASPSERATGPKVATLSNYRDLEGQVVTFSGRVIKILESQRGGDFAVMFEDKSWKRGFKLVFFQNAHEALGGSAYVKGLRGATIEVRGLIINHPKFGYEIIVNNRTMILGVGR